MSNNHFYEDMLRAVQENNLENVKALLSVSPVNINRFLDEWTIGVNKDKLLHICESVEITKELLLSGANVNAKNAHLETPLHSAAKFGKRLDLVKELLDYGADVTVKSREGKSVLDYAVERSCKNFEVIRELFNYGPFNFMGYYLNRYYSNSASRALAALFSSKLTTKFTLLIHYDENFLKNVYLTHAECNRFYRLSTYRDGCVSEVLKMKKDEIKHGLTLHDYVLKHFNGHVVSNNKLYVKLSQTDYSKQYPIYNDVILGKLVFHKIRLILLRNLDKVQMYTYSDHDVKIKQVILDYDSKYTITGYLCNEDLVNLKEAFNVSPKKHVDQSLSVFNNPVEPIVINDAKRIKLE